MSEVSEGQHQKLKLPYKKRSKHKTEKEGSKKGKRQPENGKRTEEKTIEEEH